jgi:hypothetical protein
MALIPCKISHSRSNEQVNQSQQMNIENMVQNCAKHAAVLSIPERVNELQYKLSQWTEQFELPKEVIRITEWSSLTPI